LYTEFDHDYSISPDRCSDPIPITIHTNWTQYEIILDIPSIDGKIIGNAGNDYLAIQIWTYFKDGNCLLSDGNVEAPATPRARGGSGSSCSGGDIPFCEPCRSGWFNTFSYKGTLSLSQFQLETGIEASEFHKTPYQETLNNCRLYYEASDCNSISVTDPFTNVTGLFSDTVRFITHKKSPTQVTLTVIESTELQSDGSSTEVVDINIDSNKIDSSSFVIDAGCAGAGSCVLKFEYEADSDIYRLEETVPEPI
jgi:hypothetical protein